MFVDSAIELEVVDDSEDKIQHIRDLVDNIKIVVIIHNHLQTLLANTPNPAR